MKTPSTKTPGSVLTKGTTPTKPNPFNCSKASNLAPAGGGKGKG